MWVGLSHEVGLVGAGGASSVMQYMNDARSSAASSPLPSQVLSGVWHLFSR